jgi:hypothetical protein
VHQPDPGEHGVRVAAGHHLRARVANAVGHVRRLGPRALREQQAGEVRRRADARAAVGDAPASVADRGDEGREVGRTLGRGHQEQREHREARNRREVERGRGDRPPEHEARALGRALPHAGEGGGHGLVERVPAAG